jgi:hypothetical protein
MQCARGRPKSNPLRHRGLVLRPGKQTAENHRLGWISATTALSLGTYNDAEIDILSIKTDKRKTLLRGGFFGRYVPSGHPAFMRKNTLFAVPFDLSRLAVSGAPQPALEEVSHFSGSTR